MTLWEAQIISVHGALLSILAFILRVVPSYAQDGSYILIKGPKAPRKFFFFSYISF